MKPADLKKLQTVAASHDTAPGYTLASKKDMKNLEAAGFVESNADIAEGDKIAYRATQAGLDALAAPATDAPVADAPKPSFEIQSGIPIPAVERKTREGGGRTETYPFSKLGINDSFFIASDKEDPSKGFASTIHTAHKRFEKAGELRRFVVRNVNEPRLAADGVSQVMVKGFRVWRVADGVPTVAPAPAPVEAGNDAGQPVAPSTSPAALV